LQARVYVDSGHLELVGPDLAGNPLANVVTFAPAAVTIAGAQIILGRVVSSTAVANGLELVQMLGAAQAITHLTFPEQNVMRYEVIDWGGQLPSEVSVAGGSDGSEHFYGFGEKFNAFDQTGKKTKVVTFDGPGPKGDHSYKAVPWFISTRGYGFHLDSSAESSFDMRLTKVDRYIVTNRFSSLKFNVVYGPKLTDVLTRYTAYTGRPTLPPPWVFGPWISSDVWRNGGEVRYAVTKFRNLGIPASVFVFDSPWETAYNDFTFNKTQFGANGTFEGKEFDRFDSPAEMINFFQKQGLKVICWTTPFINDQSNHDEVTGQLAKASNYDDGAGPRPSNLCARAWAENTCPVGPIDQSLFRSAM